MFGWSIRQVAAMAIMAVAALAAMLAGILARRIAAQKADAVQVLIRLGALALVLISAALMFL